jgi:hypothetical protein
MRREYCEGFFKQSILIKLMHFHLLIKSVQISDADNLIFSFSFRDSAGSLLEALSILILIVSFWIRGSGIYARLWQNKN